MSLADLLQFIQHHQIFLRPGLRGTIRLWAPGRRISRSTRQAIKEHAPMLRDLLSNHDIRVCPAPGLHRQEWYHVGQGKYVCEVCERLQPYLSAQRKEEEKKAS